MRLFLVFFLASWMMLNFIFGSSSSQLALETTQELSAVPLQIQGTLPVWLEGTLVPNGPVVVYQDGKQVGHWFDGPAMLVAFQFHKGKLFYANRYLETIAYDKVVKEGSMDFGGFESSSSLSFFRRL